MRKNLCEQLFSRYPEILGQCRRDGLAVGDGFFALSTRFAQACKA